MDGNKMLLKDIHESFKNHWHERAKDRTDIRYSNGEDFDTMLDQGLRILQAWHENLTDDNFKVISVEKPFSIDIENLDVPIIAESIASVFNSNPNAEMLAIVGNNHILKKLDWQDHVIDKHGSIRQYLSKNRGGFKIFSIGQLIGESVYEIYFWRESGPIDGAVAVDSGERFAGWKLGIGQSVAIKPAKMWELLDGGGCVLKFAILKVTANL